MCGIAGIVRPGGLRPEDPAAAERMGAALRHRGPDGHGTWAGEGVVFAHRRLAVVDLSPAAAQPMLLEGGAFALTYNGEVYNHALLRAELERDGVQFGSQSDTEVLLAAWRAWGEGCVARLNGMYAFGAWESARRRLLLARDPYGQKPLYYLPLEDGGLAFASELRALRQLPEAPRELDRLGLAQYLAYDFFPGERTVLRGVRKLPPGGILSWEAGRLRLRRAPRRRYGELTIDPREAAAELWRLLRRSVERRLMSDVPLGVFLSGGIDSSAVLAAMAAGVDPRRIHTFAIGFPQASFDESAAARGVAAQFGVQHRERVLDGPCLLAHLDEVLAHLDEPLADVSIVPTYALAKFAREEVTVALGGDGGDELFAGYDTFLAERLARPYLRLPGAVRRGAAALAERLPPSARRMSLQFRARRFVRGLDPDPGVRNIRWFGSFLAEEAAGLLVDPPPPAAIYGPVQELDLPPGEQAALELWTALYLPEDVLTKVDRASMAVSLEVRAPLLDPELARFAHGLPYGFKLRGLTRKWIFKQALRDRLPAWVLQRPKQGFGAPNGEWLRGPLRAEAERLMDPVALRRGGLLRPEPVQRLLQEHLAGRADHRKELWALFVLLRWLERAELSG